MTKFGEEATVTLPGRFSIFSCVRPLTCAMAKPVQLATETQNSF